MSLALHRRLSVRWGAYRRLVPYDYASVFFWPRKRGNCDFTRGKKERTLGLKLAGVRRRDSEARKFSIGRVQQFSVKLRLQAGEISVNRYRTFISEIGMLVGQSFGAFGSLNRLTYGGQQAL